MKNQKATIFNEQLPIEYKKRIEQLMDDLIDQKIIDWDLGYYLQSLKDEDRYWFEIWTKVYDLSYLSMNGVMRMEEGKPVLDEDWVCEFVDVMRKVQTICETPMRWKTGYGSCPDWEHHQNTIRWRHFHTA
tara:strand:+ start:252 stop:644 length:393 start_codon:yes stop_codon:yes gene_type:complete